ncbi:DUF2931 family protein [Vibrio sp. Hep-1b-8]|uniref:DUF2931 family protein n=1 Tax=Vibrio sp. Hep-1b-8 TaxID=2144187 RepID=UPI0011102758|nr:DUF2931 family protein [Vibrio sp. Hep-1b-8]TMX32320.1 nitroreductase [Vibrio sp. Hep-1b-8]
MRCLDIKWFIALLGLIPYANANAFSRAPNVPEDMPKWRVGYAMSTLYPVKVTKAYGENKQGGWISFVHNYLQYFYRTEYDYMTKSYPSYDGYGIVLGAPIGYSSQVAGTNNLPDSITIYWTSISNAKSFITQFELPDRLKDQMVIKDKYITWDGVELECYRNDIVFGFIPNGITKIWIRGCAEYKFVTELEPIKELDMDSFGNDAEIYRINYGKRMAERAKQLGATLDPIPWDKVIPNQLENAGLST